MATTQLDQAPQLEPPYQDFPAPPYQAMEQVALPHPPPFYPASLTGYAITDWDEYGRRWLLVPITDGHVLVSQSKACGLGNIWYRR